VLSSTLLAGALLTIGIDTLSVLQAGGVTENHRKDASELLCPLRTARPEHGRLGMGNIESTCFYLYMCIYIYTHVYIALQGINRVFSKVFEISSVVNYTHFLMWKALDMVAWSSQKPSQQNVFRVPTVLQQIGVVAVVP